jgi:6-phosphogluconolactonase (cycloisomerase 2 family)
MRVHGRRGSRAIPAMGIAIAVAFLYSSRIEPPQLAASEEVAAAIDTSRLVSIQHVVDGDMCPMPEELPAAALSNVMAPAQPASLTSEPQPETMTLALMNSFQDGNLFAALQRGSPAAPASETRGAGSDRLMRTIVDTHPTYSAIAVDVNSNDVILQDNNRWSYRVFNRLDNTAPGEELTPPKRLVQGDKTSLQFNNGLYVDPNNGDIYSVESDTGDKMVVFPREADGNVEPKRILATPHRVYNIAVDEGRSELFVTVEYPPEIVVYPKGANGKQAPLRRIRGDATGLDAPHGIAVDEKNQLLYVNTWGHHSNYRIPGTGRFYPPAIKVYPLNATEDTPPLRVITGDKTQLNWPAAMKLNPDTGDLYVANDIGQSVLVFKGAATAQGNVAPVRVLKGDKTRLRNPTGLFLDRKNQELWVSNLGNASATAYPLMATGNVPPLRVIRSAPEGTRSLNFGRTAAVAYDPTREQLLVPN